jgi:hypothetical protein
MTAVREAIVLPAMFLTVALLGGLRIGDTVRLVPPPLIALVLAMLLLATLVRAGALAPDRLMNAQRAPIENASGILVLIAVFAASAQVFSLLTPELGLLHAVFSACFFVQLVTTLAGVSGRSNLLRSLVVLLGSALVLRFIVLENLYAPNTGTLKRLLTTLIEGASLGTIDYQPHAAATGYIAFCTVVLYLIGLALLPAGAGRVNVRALRPAPGTDLVLLFFAFGAVGTFGLTATGCGGSSAKDAPDIRAAEAREAALRSARVWRPPSVPVSQADLAANPRGPGSFQATDDVSCRLVIGKLSGLTPKFHCEMPDGEVLKVKYGASNGELSAEVAGSRLLAALGFGADAMYVVRKVRCRGCSRFPFRSLQCLEATGMKGPCYLFAGEQDVVEFDTVVIERPLAGEEIESGDDEGWAWYELEKIDPASGGSPRAEVDALRLLAVVLAHWDNKSGNQRIICLPGGERPGGGCTTPLAMIHDLGATFGPTRIDLPNWRRSPVWADRATCTVSMKTLPYAGATFPDWRISEGGRLMLLGLLEQLSTEQLTGLFTASRMVEYDHMLADARSAAAWTQAFQDKVRQIKDGGSCPQ